MGDRNVSPSLLVAEMAEQARAPGTTRQFLRDRWRYVSTAYRGATCESRASCSSRSAVRPGGLLSPSCWIDSPSGSTDRRRGSGASRRRGALPGRSEGT